MKRNTRRFGVHEVKKGQHKGSLHVATEKYQAFSKELYFLSNYLDRRILPSEPEEIKIRNIILNIQNILEHEIEEAIKIYLKEKIDKKNLKFFKRLNEGYVSFKEKYDWLIKINIISKDTWEQLEQIRQIRNAFIHSRPAQKRIKYKYFNQPLMTLKTLRQIFCHAEKIRIQLIKITGNKIEKWPLIPPGYAYELNWKEAIEIYNSKERSKK